MTSLSPRWGAGTTERTVLQSVLRRTVPLVLLAGLLAAVAGYVISERLLPNVYRSSATVIVNQTQARAPDAPLATEPFTNDQSLGETFQELALQPNVSDQVARDLDESPAELRRATTVRAVPRTPLIVIAVEGSTPDQAARRTQAYTAQFVQSTLGNDVLPGRALVVSAATVPTETVAPRPLLNALVAGVAALLLGIGGICAWTLLGPGQASARARERAGPAWLVRGTDAAPDAQDSAPEHRPATVHGAYERRSGA